LSKLIIIDNFDSFTYNLVHYLEPYCNEIIVYRNDNINYHEIAEDHKIILSPGPGLPMDNIELFIF
jgi:Anthranilate/para-aminobenzoate synthases component II